MRGGTRTLLFFLHGYESLIGHCAFDWADVGADADAGSFGKIEFETRQISSLRDEVIWES